MKEIALLLLLSAVPPPKAPPIVEVAEKAPPLDTPYNRVLSRVELGETVTGTFGENDIPGYPAGKYGFALERGCVVMWRVEEAKQAPFLHHRNRQSVTTQGTHAPYVDDPFMSHSSSVGTTWMVPTYTVAPSMGRRGSTITNCVG